MYITNARSFHRLTAALLLAMALVFVAGAPTTTFAAISICRTDPIVWFTDGSRVQMSVSIGADVSNVVKIVYVIQTPLTKKVSKIVYTGGALAGKESVTVVAGKLNNGWTTQTTVMTLTSKVPVTAYSSYNGSQRAQLSGLSGQTLTMNFTAQ